MRSSVVRRRRRMRRRMRRRVIIGSAVLIAVGTSAFKMSKSEVDQVEQYTGQKVEELSEEQLDAAMGDLGLEGQEPTDQEIALLEEDERSHLARVAPASANDDNARMRLHELHVGCFGGGTGLPSGLGGLKRNPWLAVNAVVTMFDSGGSSGVLRDELGVLPPGDVLRCALALARNEAEARHMLLTRLPTLEHKRLGGHTAGNLLLSMMEQYSGEFLAAVDGLRTLLGCVGRVWPISVERSSLCAAYSDGMTTKGEVEVDAGQFQGRSVQRIWLEPAATIRSERPYSFLL